MFHKRSQNKDFTHPIGEYAKKEKVPFGVSEVVLFIVIVLGILITLFAYYQFNQSQGVIYEHQGGVVHVIGYEGRNGRVSILDEYEGRRVTTIARGAFEANSYVEHIELGQNIEVIEGYAFYNAENLHTVSLHNSSEIQSVGIDILLNTPYHDNQEGPLYFLDTILYDGKQYNDIHLTLPETTHLIANEAFKDNNNITYITFNESLKFIGEEAFGEMGSLEQLTFETHVMLKEIGRRAFYNASSLSEVEAPQSTQIRRIGAHAFGHTPWRAAQNENYYQFGDIRIDESLAD